MPAHRKTTAEHRLSGAFDHNPARERAREGEPVPDEPIGDPPMSLHGHELACWHEIVDSAHPGVLMKPDRLYVEHGARLLAKLRDAKWDVLPALLLRWETFLSRLGMTPADRSRVAAKLKADGKADPFAALFGDDDEPPAH